MEGLFLDGLSSLPVFNLLFGGDADNQSIGAGSEAAGRARATSQKKSSTARNLDVVRMHPRILAVGKPWDRRTEKEAHRNNAAELGRALERKYGRRYLMVNLSGACAGSACGNGTGLSPSKTAASLSGKVDYHRLRYQVLECDLESKPSLETLFRLCHAVKLFLSLDSRNVVAIFCKNGVHTCRLFLSAYFAFIGKFPDTNAALEDFYYRRVRVNYDAQHILMHAQPSLRHFLQQFQSTIRNDGVPHRKPLVAFMLLIEHLPRIADKGLMKTNIFNIFGPSADEVDRTVQPIVRIYQSRGNRRRVLVYSSLSDPDSCVHWDPAVGKLRLKCNVELLGDAEIDCVFPGDTNKHLFRYFMHTSFMPESGVVTVTRTDIQTASKHVFPENFKMEIIVQHGQIPAKGTHECAAIEDTFRFLRSKIPREDALTILSDLHFINPDPQLCRELTAAGHPEQQVRFALQRTNNILQVARELLKPKNTPNKDDNTSPASLQSPKDETMDPVSPVSDSPFSEVQGDSGRTPDKLVADTSIIISPPRTSQTCTSDPDPRHALMAMIQKRASPSQDDVVAPQKNTAGDASRTETTDPNGDPRQALMAMIQKRAPSCRADSPGSLGTETIGPHTTSQNDASQPSQGEMPERAGNTTRAKPDEVAKSNVDKPKEVAKFKRMFSVGVPEGAVRAKMMQENVDPALLFGVDAAAKSRGPPPPEYAKFDKMLKMGVPEGAVVAKMRLENLDPTWIGIGVEAGSSQQPGQQSATKPRDHVRRKKFHWEAIPESRLKQNSIWTVSRGVAKFRRGAARAQDKLQIETKEVKARTEHDQHSAIACDQQSQQQQQRGRRSSLGSVASDGGLLSPTHVIADETDPDMKELELLFTMRPAAANANCTSNTAQKAGTSSKPAAKARKATRVALLDMKRSQNVSIGLKRIKLSGKDICTALNAFDDKVLTHERLQILQSAQMLPTQEEEKVLGGFRGNVSTLGEAEQFLMEIVLSVQEPKIRLDAMYFRAEFSERLQELNARVDLVRRACKSVRDSQSLQKVFQVVLLVGNKINAEGPASIRGFTVASLLKLSQTKSFNRKTTILDFIAQFAMKRIPEVLDVDTELSVLSEAKRLQFAIFDAEESGLHMGYQAVMRAIKAAERETKADVRTPKGEASRNGAKFQVDAGSADQAFASSDEGAASHGLERLCAFSRDVQDALTQLEASLEAMRDEYSDLLEFFCEEADLPAQDFFATLDTFLKSFGTAARSFRETQRRKAARERAERQRLTLKRSESLRGGCGRKGDTPGSSFETPRKAKSFKDPRPRAVGDSPCGNVQVSGHSSSLSFRTPQPRKLMQQENEVENCSENVSSSAGPKLRSKPLSQTPSLSRFLAEI
ncbi:Formin-like protein 3 [Hondaea fermentalgiana]|uniref:Formin-like protein 3 n=1 Tax=Hondaea fermentalgiana TaxID=2315210 RepID=A0A2R5G866_9STRA|nr:Formin-like protein 3 [Hondaea fermentalgiana]|eukprot:GBG23884.1 Formin-like protein 3 [Hondaea fermentalgiana]